MKSADPRKRLLDLAAAKGDSLSQLSVMLGRNVSYLQQFVRKGSPRRLEERDRRKLADYFGVSEAELAALPALLHTRGVGFSASPRPVFVVSYRRSRFVDPRTGTRIALDQDIHAPRHALACPGADCCRTLPWAVIETKGSLAVLPPFLAPLVPMGLRPDAFSKYLHCYLSLMQQPL